MLIYLDMDGVLTDLDENVAQRADVSMQKMADPVIRTQLIRNSIQSRWLGHWTELGAPNKAAWRRLIRRWTSAGHKVEILTSYGTSNFGMHHEGEGYPPPAMGAIAHMGKVRWLLNHYAQEFPGPGQRYNGSITGFNGVEKCEQKAHFAGPDRLLIDDQPENVEQFKAAGGRAVLYERVHHDELMDALDLELMG
jgi:FMN phosphatase YigB (HAD superfamily)